ncbi:MAG: bifunctional acetate--CoA ligase family protein/GNAT family N-acetyltransferase [Nocardioidaceae bacterium]
MTTEAPGRARPADFRPVHVLLADGTGAQIRAAGSGDHDEVAALHARASDESIYRRFFSVSRAAVDAFVDVICGSSPQVWSLVAVRSGRLVGVATASDTGTDEAEVAFLVDEELHGIGIATALLEQLAAWARRRGLSTFVAEVLVDNPPMLRVFHDAGYQLSEQREHGEITLTMDLRVGADAVAAADARERQAERRSLRALFEPRSVAVLGVSRDDHKIGHQILANVQRAGYDGALFALGRPDLRVPGVTCVSTLEELPDDLDLVVVVLPGPTVETAVRRVADKGARCCVVISSGLGETGAAGRDTEARMTAYAGEHGMRLVGPNCFGVLSNLRETRLDATFGWNRPAPGTLAVGSQSGGVGLALLGAAEARGTGVACFVSLGNKADVSGNDLLAAWNDDPDVHAAALYLESFHDPRKFARLAAAFNRRKPLLVVFGGSSAAGTRAGASHTAAHATSARAIHALFRAAGVIDVESIQDLVDTAALLTEQPRPRGPRLGIVGNAGGLGIIAADAAHRLGLDVPELGPATRAALRDAVPGLSGDANPVDLGAAADAASFERTVRLLLTSGEVDTVLVGVAATTVTDTDAIGAAVDRAAAGTPDLPCLLVPTGAAPRTERHHAGEPATADGAHRATRFATSEAAVAALRHAVRYQLWLRTADAPVPLPATADDDRRAGPEDTAGTWLDAGAAADLLASVGVRSVDWRLVGSVREAIAAAHDLGFPLVVKSATPDVVHKTEDHLVRTGLENRRELVAAVHDIQVAQHARTEVLVQRQLEGPEIAVGLVRDPQFGPLVMVASGGVTLDLWEDQTFLMPPLGRHDVRSALEGLRTWPLLNGFRGSRRLDSEAVVSLVCAVARLALERPDVVELDLNPVIVTESGPWCVDSKVRVRTRQQG